jgi:uncharacterized protein
MPVKSSNSSVLRWPRRSEVMEAVRAWAADARASRTDLLRVGHFGSLRRSDWGFGSDPTNVATIHGPR